MPAHSKRTKAYKRRGRNEYNELVSAETQSSLSDCPVSPVPGFEIVYKIAELTQTVRDLASPDIDARVKRSMVKEISVGLLAVSAASITAIKEATESTRKSKELHETLNVKIDSLPPALTKEEATCLEVLHEVNNSRRDAGQADLTSYLIRKALRKDSKEPVLNHRKIRELYRIIEKMQQAKKDDRKVHAARVRMADWAKSGLAKVKSPESQQKMAEKVV